MQPIITIAFALLAGCTGSSAPPTDHWHQLEAEGNRLTSTFRGALWEQNMLPVHNQFWPGVYQACAPQARASGVGEFKAIAAISNSGVVTEYLINPDKPALRCFSAQMIGKKYPAPPESPFYEVYTINLHSR